MMKNGISPIVILENVLIIIFFFIWYKWFTKFKYNEISGPLDPKVWRPLLLYMDIKSSLNFLFSLQYFFYL